MYALGYIFTDMINGHHMVFLIAFQFTINGRVVLETSIDGELSQEEHLNYKG